MLEALKALGKDDPEMSEVVLKRLRAEGVEIREGALVERVTGGARLIDVHISEGGVPGVVQGTHLLVATGRSPNVAGLNLEAAGIKYDKRGIQVSKGLVTSNSRVFAIGDVIGGPQFTHVANYHAGIVIRRAPVPAAGHRQHRHHPVGDVHRSGAGPRRPDRGRRQEALRRACASSAGPTTRTTGPRPSGRPRASSRWSPTPRARSWAPASSASMPAS